MKICLYWKIVYIAKSFTLKNYLHYKNHWKLCLHWKTIFIEKNYFHWKKYLHWKIAFIEKTTSIEKLLSLKKLLPLKNYFHWKNCFHWKTTFIEKNVSIEYLIHIQNVAFKFFFDIWCKLMYENFPFPLEKKVWTWLYNKSYLNQNFDIGRFHIYKWFVY
jgi:hypothetical protein